MKKKLLSLTMAFVLLAAIDVSVGALSSGDIAATAGNTEVSVSKETIEIAVPATEELTEPAAATPEEVTEITEDQSAINVIVPSTLDFTIDPLELAGQGQVYSDAQKVENCGETDVLLTFTDITVSFANETDFEALTDPFDERRGSGKKAIYMLLDFGRDDVSPIVITGGNLEETTSVLLRANGEDMSACSLSLSGSVEHLPAVEWMDGDVKIRLTYQITESPPLDSAAASDHGEIKSTVPQRSDD